MRKLVPMAAAALLVAQASPAFLARADAAEGAKPRKICKLSSETATRMSTRTCLTADQWRALKKRISKENATAEAENENMLRSQAEIPEMPSGQGGVLPAPGYPK